jgi:hypothetical protein
MLFAFERPVIEEIKALIRPGAPRPQTL